MARLPTGNVTFLFTDIEGSTRLWQEHPGAMQAALDRHHAILEHAIQTRGGHIFQIIGDAFCASFRQASDALAAALDIQRALRAESWKETGPVRVRIGLHSGVAEARADEYISSLHLVRVQRVMSAGHGGQILLSPTTAELVGQQMPKGTLLKDLGRQRLRGIAHPEHIFQAVAADLPAEFAPLRGVQPVAGDAENSAVLARLERSRFVARSAELKKLHQHWELARQARGQLVMLSGEPGIGKTRLALELVSRAHQDGAHIFQGGCYEYEATTPYLPFVEALRTWVKTRTVEDLRKQLGQTASELTKLAPEIESRLGALNPNPSLAPGEERLRLFDNMARFLQSLAARNGLLLFVDDLHWADRGTLSMLHYLLRHLRSDRILVLGTYRDVELERTHPLAGILVDWNRERLVTRLALSRFDLGDTRDLLANLLGQNAVSDEFADLIYRETEGNPFFIEEVIKALIEQGEIFRSKQGWQQRRLHELTLPQSVKEALGRRLGRLNQACTQMLTTAAGLGKQFDFSELAAAAAQDEDTILDALDEAAAAQLIAPAGEESFAFTHDKIREVLIEELNPIRRRRLHRRIAESLENLNVSNLLPRAGDLAYHFTLSGDLQKSLDYSLQAASNAANLFGHDEALAYYRQARDAAEDLGLKERMVTIDEAIGIVYSQRGEVKPAIDAFRQALSGATDTDRRAIIKARIGCVYGMVGDPQGLPYLHQAVEELDADTQIDHLANATAHLGRYHHYHARHTQAIEYLEQARRLAEPIGNPLTLLLVYGFLAGAYQHMAQFENSDQWARAAIMLGEKREHMPAQSIGHEFLAENAACRGHWEEALHQTAQNRKLADKVGALNRRAWSEYPRMVALLGTGHLQQAFEVAQTTLALCDQIGEPRLATWTEPTLAIIATELGEDDIAQRHARSGLLRGEKLGQVALHSYSLHAMGYRHMRMKNWQKAAGFYQQLLGLLGPTENRIVALYANAYAAEAFLGLGLIAEAGQLIDETIVLAKFAQAPHLEALSGRVNGQILARQGQTRAAAAALDDAVRGLDRLGSRLELGRALYHRAVIRFKHRNGDSARRDADRALQIFSACGARRDVELARAQVSES